MKGGSDGKTSSKPGNHKDNNRSACQWVDAWNRWAKHQTVKTLQQKHCITKIWVLPRIIKITQHFIFARQPRQTTTHVMKNAARVAWHHTKKATQRHGETTKKTREWVGTACKAVQHHRPPPYRFGDWPNLNSEDPPRLFLTPSLRCPPRLSPLAP